MSVWKVKIQCLPSWDTSADISSMIKLPSWVPRSNWLCICAFFSNKNKNLEGMSPWFVECSLFCVCVCVCVLVAQLCLPLCDPMDYSLPGSSVHGILQERILKWVAMPSSRGSSRLRDGTRASYVSCTDRWVLHHLCHLGGPGICIATAETSTAL